MTPLVLVVDDEPDLVSLLRFALETRGYAVVGAQDGPSALSALNRHHPDVVVLDLMLPGLDGWDVLAAINDGPTSDRVPVSILTAPSSTSNQFRRWQTGAPGSVANHNG